MAVNQGFERGTVGGTLRLCLALLAACSLTALTGCGGADGDQPETVPVSGQVTYKGKPLAEAEVTFHPQGPGNPATGRTEQNGRFVLTTGANEDGAVPGVHVVTVQVFPEGALPGMEGETSDADSIPDVYADPATSPLTAEVQRDEPNNISLELKEDAE